jgi:hypothetical protein
MVRMVAPWPGWGSGRMIHCEAVPALGATIHADGASFRVDAVHHRIDTGLGQVSEVAVIMRPLQAVPTDAG